MSAYDFHPEAELDLDEIWEYVAENSERAADRLLDDIEAALLALARFPHQGQVRPELTGRPLRFKPVRSYLIAYAPNERPLWVVAVMHGARSPRVMAAILRGRE